MTPETIAQVRTIALVLYLPLMIGYLFRKMDWIGAAWTRPTMKWVFIIIEPPITMYSMWGLGFSHSGQTQKAVDVAVHGSTVAGVASIIFTAALIATAMIFISRLASQPFKHSPRTRGAFIGSTVLSNVGLALGVFISLLFLGFPGQQVAIIYTSFFFPFLVTVMFTLGRYYGSAQKMSFGGQVKSLFTEPLSLCPITGFVLGIVLNYLARQNIIPHPPESIVPINWIIVRSEVAICAFAIGCSLMLRNIKKYWRECATICGLKFIVMPIVGIGVVFLLRGMGLLSMEPIVQKTVFIETFMPSAIMSTVFAKLFLLDEHLSNSAWVVTTIASVIVLPFVYLIVT